MPPSLQFAWDEAYLSILPAGYSATVTLEIESEYQPEESRTWDYPGSPGYWYVVGAKVLSLVVYDERGDEKPWKLTDEQREAVLVEFWEVHSTSTIEEALRD